MNNLVLCDGEEQKNIFVNHLYKLIFSVIENTILHQDYIGQTIDLKLVNLEDFEQDKRITFYKKTPLQLTQNKSRARNKINHTQAKNSKL